MNGRIAAIGLSMWIVAGCQAPPSQPASAPPAPVPNPPPATQAGAPRTVEQMADTRADSAAKLASAHAKAIEALMAAKSAAPNGVTPVDPSATPTPPPSQPVQASIPPGTTPLKSEGGDDVFKPVPPPPSGGAAAIGAAVGFTPPAETPPAAGVVMSQPSVPLPAPAADTPRPAIAKNDPLVNDPLEAQIQKAARDAPSDLAPQLDAQLLKFVKGETVPTPDVLAALSAEDRDVLTAIMDGLSNFRTSIRLNNNMLITRKIRPLTDMGDRLRSRSDLAINNTAVCRSIKGWGNYDPISPLRLPAGLENWPGLYYEVENFSSTLDGNNMWKTTMRQDVAIYDERGALVWQWPNEPVTDICRNRRHDFYVALKVKRPIRLPAGAFILKVTLTDQTAGRVAETSVPLTMVTPAAVPAQPAGPPLR